MNRKAKVSIGIAIICAIICVGYVLRIDRFGMSKISWVDCLQINKTKYYSDFNRSPVELSNIGKKIGEVKFNVSEKVGNPNYRFRNGDATYLDVGTEIYSIDSENNAVAVKIDNQYYLYESRNE